MSSEVVIRLLGHGPMIIEGPVRVLDGDGNEVSLPSDKPAVVLCRCSHSDNMPFCDGCHKTCGFPSSKRPT